MPYYEYYSFSYYSYFFFILILFFFLILILFPDYTKKDIVPPLSDANYEIREDSIGDFKLNDINTSTFQNLIINDGVASGTSAIDFGTSGPDEAFLSYIPYYNEAHRRIIGFFELNIGTSLKRTLAFRAVDVNQNPDPGLNNYNYGWTSLVTEQDTSGTTPNYRVVLPFNLPGYNSTNHNIRVQIAADTGNKTGLELSSAYLYYYSV